MGLLSAFFLACVNQSDRIIKVMEIRDILAIGLPTLTVLVGILLNRSEANRLDARITTEVATLRADIALIRNDQRKFYRTLGQHEVRVENIEKK